MPRLFPHRPTAYFLLFSLAHTPALTQVRLFTKTGDEAMKMVQVGDVDASGGVEAGGGDGVSTRGGPGSSFGGGHGGDG